jgi:hypothetical protein
MWYSISSWKRGIKAQKPDPWDTGPIPEETKPKPNDPDNKGKGKGKAI